MKLGNGLRAELLEADFDRSIDFPITFWLGRGGSILDDKCIPHPCILRHSSAVTTLEAFGWSCCWNSP